MVDATPIRVMIVDDYPNVRHGLTLFIQAFDDLALAGEASTGEEALTLCAETRPDVVLTDLKLPDMSGVDVIRSIHQTHPRIQVIALTSFRDEALMHAAREAGAADCLLKNVSIDALAEAIRSAYADDQVS
jgi:DNA-binding NarL/FixJ family response regulator